MVATVIAGTKRVTLPEDVRQDLGLEDGIEYVMEQTGDVVMLRPSATAVRMAYPPLDDTLDEAQIEALQKVDRLFGSLKRYRNGPPLSIMEEREAFEWGVADENSRGLEPGQ